WTNDHRPMPRATANRSKTTRPNLTLSFTTMARARQGIWRAAPGRRFRILGGSKTSKRRPVAALQIWGHRRGSRPFPGLGGSPTPVLFWGLWVEIATKGDFAL